MELNLEKFNPKKAELKVLGEKYKDLEITSIEDKVGYTAVDTARKELKQIRVNIQKTGKEMRDDANKFAKKVIDAEKELISVIEPIEKQLKEKQEKVDELKEIEKRKSLLPARKELLEKIDFKLSNDEILKMNSDEFQSFYNCKKEEYLEEKERKLKEEQEKIEKEKQEREEEEKRKKEIEKAKKEAEEKVKREQEEKERKQKQEEEVKKQVEIEEQKKLEKEKRYKDFLKKNEGKFDKIVKEEGKVVLYKIVDEFIL